MNGAGPPKAAVSEKSSYIMRDVERYPTPVDSTSTPAPPILSHLEPSPPFPQSDKEVASMPRGRPWGDKSLWVIKITRTRLWILLVVLLLFIGGIVGGAVGGTLAAKSKNDSALATTGTSVAPTAITSGGSESTPTMDPTTVGGAPPLPTATGPAFISQGNVNFSYFDCLGEPTTGRALLYRIEGDQVNMTVQRCLSECWFYEYAGLEWGQECWCANKIGLGTVLHDTGCNMTCKGNTSQICGGNVHLTTYQFNVTKAALNKGS